MLFKICKFSFSQTNRLSERRILSPKMEAKIDLDNIVHMKYHDLQRLAKKHGIRANMKSDKLVKAIQDYVLSQASQQQQDALPGSPGANSGRRACKPSSAGCKVTASPCKPKITASFKQAVGSPALGKEMSAVRNHKLTMPGIASPALKRIQPKTPNPKTPVLNQIKSKSVNNTSSKSTGKVIPKSPPEINRGCSSSTTKGRVASTSRGRAISTSKDCVASTSRGRATSTSKGRVASTSRGRATSTSKGRVASTSRGRATSTSKGRVASTSRGRPGFIGKSPVATARKATNLTPKTPASNNMDEPKSATKSTSKSAVISAKKTPESLSRKRKLSQTCSPQKQSPGAQKRPATPTSGGAAKRSRRGTYSMERSSPNVEHLLGSMKEGMSDEERKASLLSALDNITAKKGQQGSESNLTQIPRFTSHTANNAQKKTATPGKDWSRIHQRQFSKMAGLDEYLARKRERTATLTASLRKIQDRAKGMESKLHSLKKQSTIGAKPRQVSGSSKSLKFLSPAPTTFKPSVTSTSKISVNFSGNSSKKMAFTGKSSAIKPAAGERSSPRNASHKAAKQEGGKENLKAASLLEVKLPGAQSKQRGASSELDTSAAARQAKFNLQASLQRKMTWTPHKGQLKPFVPCDPYNSVKKPDVKARPAKSREVRRAEAKDHRAKQRHMSQMSRRGLPAQ